MINAQDFPEPLEAFRGEFPWLCRFQSFTLNAVSHASEASLRPVKSGACLILIDYMTELIEFNQILSRRNSLRIDDEGPFPVSQRLCGAERLRENALAHHAGLC